MTIRIVTDSTCDLPVSVIDELGITAQVIPGSKGVYDIVEFTFRF